MDRRLVITALACWPAARVPAAEDATRPRHKISAAQLHAALSARFPIRLRLGGLLELQASAPRLLLLPARNKLGATLVAEVSGLRARDTLVGEMEMVFTVRYEASDRSLRAHDPEILDIRAPGLPPEAALSLRGVLPAMTRNVGEVVLHRFSDQDLALPSTMGFEPEEIRVLDDGLLILFGPKTQSR